VEEIKLDERNGEIKSMAGGLESLLAPVLDNYLKICSDKTLNLFFPN